MQIRFALVLPVWLSLATSTALAQIHTRPAEAWAGSSLPELEYDGSCTGGGRNVYLKHGGSVRPTKIGICEWLHSGNTFSQKMRYFQGATGGVPIRTYVGCHIPGGLEYHLAFYDMEDGYQPMDRIFIDSNAALVLLQSRNYYLVRNNHITKHITVSYRLGNDQTIGTVRPQSELDVVASEVYSSHYTLPYRDPDYARCD